MNSNKELLDSGYTRFSAPAKLNLFLKVINKRKDGYHNIQSVFQLIDLQDDIFIKLRNKDNQITIKNSSLLILPHLRSNFNCVLKRTEAAKSLLISAPSQINSYDLLNLFKSTFE